MTEVIELPVNVHLVLDPEGEDNTIRTKEQVREIFKDVNRIWSQAKIHFKISSLEFETIEHDKVNQLLDKMYKEIPSNNSNEIDVYFLKNFHVISGINLGYTRRELRRVFVVDELRGGFNDHRCIAHEFGHVLRLDHVFHGDRLMLQQGNEELLLNWEIKIARHMAKM